MTELLLLSESSKNTWILENLSNINLKVFLGFHEEVSQMLLQY